MKTDIGLLAKIVSPRILARFLSTMDKASMVIVSVCWGGAIVMMLVALYTVHLSVAAKRDTVEALATEPSLPVMRMAAPKISELEPLASRLERRFPGITFNLSRDLSLTVSTNNGSLFRTWLTVLSYIDTISPDYRWQLKEFCVGMQCGGSTPMKAVLIPKKITFSPPAVTKE